MAYFIGMEAGGEAVRLAKCFSLPLAIAWSLLLVADPVGSQTFTTIHTFSDTTNWINSDGAESDAQLVLSGNVLYGTAYYGGSSGTGTIFRITTNGAAFTTLHSFAPYAGAYNFPTNGEGANPSAGLTLSGSTLYGTASIAGAFGFGTIFKMNTDGTGFTVLHHFAYADGIYPMCSLLLVGDSLYGTAEGGGSAMNGTVFKLGTNGTGFTVLHNFSASSGSYNTNSDGRMPDAALTISGNTLYGTTYGGGNSGEGTVFKVNTDGTGFTTLHAFTTLSNYYFSSYGYIGTNPDGANPYAGLVLSGNSLYGVANYGGGQGIGTIFMINTDGTDFLVLHTFIGGYDGATPFASLTLNPSANTLYGTSVNGGSYDWGSVFRINTNGSAYANIYYFNGTGNGGSAYAPLLLSGNTLYGTTQQQGSNYGTNGTVFSIALPQLGFNPQGAIGVLKWPTNSLGLVLQTTTNLSTAWGAVTSAPVVINGQNVVTNPTSGNQQFYRLAVP